MVQLLIAIKALFFPQSGEIVTCHNKLNTRSFFRKPFANKHLGYHCIEQTKLAGFFKY
jgi:hypothetical protein